MRVSLRTAAAGTERENICSIAKQTSPCPLPSLEELVRLSWSLLLALIYFLYSSTSFYTVLHHHKAGSQVMRAEAKGTFMATNQTIH